MQSVSVYSARAKSSHSAVYGLLFLTFEVVDFNAFLHPGGVGGGGMDGGWW